MVREGLGHQVRQTLHLHALLRSLRFDAIVEHLHPKWAAGAHYYRACLDSLLGTDMVHPPSDIDLHERMPATGATAQALTLVPAHLLHLDTGERLECLAWFGKDVVVTSEVARIVVRHLGSQPLPRGQATFLEQARNELAMVDHLEMAAKLWVLIL